MWSRPDMSFFISHFLLIGYRTMSSWRLASSDWLKYLEELEFFVFISSLMHFDWFYHLLLYLISFQTKIWGIPVFCCGREGVSASPFHGIPCYSGNFAGPQSDSQWLFLIMGPLFCVNFPSFLVSVTRKKVWLKFMIWCLTKIKHRWQQAHSVTNGKMRKYNNSNSNSNTDMRQRKRQEGVNRENTYTSLVSLIGESTKSSSIQLWYWPVL